MEKEIVPTASDAPQLSEALLKAITSLNPTLYSVHISNEFINIKNEMNANIQINIDDTELKEDDESWIVLIDRIRQIEYKFYKNSSLLFITSHPILLKSDLFTDIEKFVGELNGLDPKSKLISAQIIARKENGHRIIKELNR